GRLPDDRPLRASIENDRAEIGDLRAEAADRTSGRCRGQLQRVFAARAADHRAGKSKAGLEHKETAASATESDRSARTNDRSRVRYRPPVADLDANRAFD